MFAQTYLSQCLGSLWYCLKGKTERKTSMSMTKPTKWLGPAKTQISMGICPVFESSLCAQLVAKDPRFLHADSEDSDQTGQIPRLIWVFTGSTGHFVGFVMLQFKEKKEYLLDMLVCLTREFEVDAWRSLPRSKSMADILRFRRVVPHILE